LTALTGTFPKKNCWKATLMIERGKSETWVLDGLKAGVIKRTAMLSSTVIYIAKNYQTILRLD
jgi:hypothetical protein